MPEDLDDNQELWRYFKLENFLSTIEDRQVYFASANMFSDPFEGAIAVIPPEYKPDPRFSLQNSFDDSFKALTELVKISCWHIENFESNAMWKLYANDNKGIAITSNVKKLKASLKPFRLGAPYGEERPHFGKVVYKDLSTEIVSTDSIERFFFKHKAFAWEKEYRVVISLRLASELGVELPEKGVLVDTDIDELISAIFLGPSLNQNEKEQVLSIASKYGLQDRIKNSSMLGTPKYWIK